MFTIMILQFIRNNENLDAYNTRFHKKHKFHLNLVENSIVSNLYEEKTGTRRNLFRYFPYSFRQILSWYLQVDKKAFNQTISPSQI